MDIKENISLKSYNTFAIDAKARNFAAFGTVEELADGLQSVGENRLLVLGGGSNILLTGDFDGWVLKNEMKGIELISEESEHVVVKARAGENWHSFVMHCIENGWAGVENLSLIPGCVGASPMQNIGAYGVEIKDVFEGLNAYDIQDRKLRPFSLADCQFGYRESIFKTALKGRFIITDVSFRLRKKPVFHTSYGAINEELERMGVKELSIKAVSDAVIRIRSSKLPDPAQIGNAGSFFKNPSVTKEKYESLKQSHPDIVGYANADGSIKLAAGWLIEQCGWKGFRRGDAGVHARQALVLVNYGSAGGEEIYRLSTEILESVKDKFGVLLEREVNII